MNRLVEEKHENRATLAKAGAFWAALLAPLLIWRRTKKRRVQKKRWW